MKKLLGSAAGIAIAAAIGAVVTWFVFRALDKRTRGGASVSFLPSADGAGTLDFTGEKDGQLSSDV